MAPRTLTIEPLTKAGFAVFGTVIERDGAEIVMINEGRLVYEGDVESLRTKGSGDLDEAFHSLTHAEAAGT